MELFKQSTFDEAVEYIEFLKDEIKYYSEHLAKYLKKNFSQNTENS